MAAIHSQLETAQDAWVLETLKGLKDPGYFVEIGSYDGLETSNTLALELRGWTGLLVEAAPELYARTVANRPNCQHDNRAVSDRNDIAVRFSQAGLWGGLHDSLPEGWHTEYAHKFPDAWVNTVTLGTLLSDHNAPSIVDYLSLDIEGAELIVLEEFFRHPEFGFRCMTVEWRQNAEVLKRLEGLLLFHGYTLDKVQAWDAYFVSKDLL